MPIFETDVEKYAKLGKRLDDLGLARTGVTVRGADDNPMSADPKVRRKGVAANKAALDCCQAAGIETLVGPFHSALGYFSGAGPTKDEWAWAVDSMRQVAEHAESCQVTLGLEYLNRFECYLLNTAADGVRFCRDVNHPRCQMMYDTFHSHIEEKNTPAAIRALKGCLVHVHISENDRSTPGSGQRPLGRNVRYAQGNRLRQSAGDRGLRAGPGAIDPGHQDLAADVPGRASIGRRRIEVHERGSRQTLEVEAASCRFSPVRSGCGKMPRLHPVLFGNQLPGSHFRPMIAAHMGLPGRLQCLADRFGPQPQIGYETSVRPAVAIGGQPNHAPVACLTMFLTLAAADVAILSACSADF